MNTQTKTIDNIMSVPIAQRRRLRRDAERFATKQCNGDYYYNEDTKKWEGPEADKAAPLEQSIKKRIYLYCKGISKLTTPLTKNQYDRQPDFVTYENDPRGFVLKIEADKLTDEAKEYCRAIRMQQDLGGDYTILTTNEI